MMKDSVLIPFYFQNKKANFNFLHCNGKDQVAMEAYQKGWKKYEEPLPEILTTILKTEPSCFIDVGANTGFYTILAATAGAKEVHVFEPYQESIDILKKNIELNTSCYCSPIYTNEVAVSNINGETEFFIPDQGHGLVETSASLNKEFKTTHSSVQKVKTVTLDSYVNNHLIDLNLTLILKLDVEMHEPQVLLGATETIKNYRPVILIEILPGSDLNFYYQWLEENEYIHYDLYEPTAAIANKKIRSSHQKRDHLFLPKEISVQSLGLSKKQIKYNPNLAVYSTFCGATQNKTFNSNPIDQSVPHFFISNNHEILKDAHAAGWTPIHLDEPVSADPVYSAWQAKYAKALPHLIKPLNDYDFTFYKDDKINFNLDLIKSFCKDAEQNDYSFMLRPHNFLFGNILYEFGEAMLQPRYKVLWDKTTEYLTEEIKNGLNLECQMYWTSAILRNMNHPDTQKINDMWMDHIGRCGIECQISFDVIAQEFSTIGLLPLEI